jgi:hypothetical protein
LFSLSSSVEIAVHRTPAPDVTTLESNPAA